MIDEKKKDEAFDSPFKQAAATSSPTSEPPTASSSLGQVSHEWRHSAVKKASVYQKGDGKYPRIS